MCKGRYSKDGIANWSEKEAIDELNKNFPGIKKNECEQVCDGCYNIFMDRFYPRQGILKK